MPRSRRSTPSRRALSRRQALAWLLVAGLVAAGAGCSGQKPPVHHPAGAAVANPCENAASFASASRDRLNELRQCGAITEAEWTCLGTQLEYLGDDVDRRCEAGRLSYLNIAGEQQRRYSTCIVPFDPALVDCGLFTTDPACREAVCDPERLLPAVSAAPRTGSAGTPQAIADAADALVSIAVHAYHGACDFRLDSREQRDRISALLERATPASVVSHQVPAEFYLRFDMLDGTAPELVVGERWLVPVARGGRLGESVDGWRLPDVALRDYLRAQASPCR